jgi:arylsulfatase A-like enzyme
MTNRTAVCEETGSAGARAWVFSPDRSGLFQVLALAAWCGLVAGLLEVGTIIVRKHTYDYDHLYKLSRHFVWLTPLANLAIFLGVGMVFSMLVLSWRGRGGWLAMRLLGTLTLLAPIWAASPWLYGPAGFVLALGISARLVPVLERHAAAFRRLVLYSFPVLAGVVFVLAAARFGGDRYTAWRAEARPLPSAGSANVLLIVLDTVGAGHLSLHGYNRPTSPALDEFASRGIRFDRANAPSSWSLVSHASIFTGRWPHELSAGWFTPLDGAHTTIAEFLASRGYATAGFVANNAYCASDSGLDRGFAAYQDYVFPRLSAFGMAVLVNRVIDGIDWVTKYLEAELELDALWPAIQYVSWMIKDNRKEAAVINREFLDWLSRRAASERPFFAFLNYFDAHATYQVPQSGVNRFVVNPSKPREVGLLADWLAMSMHGLAPYQIKFGRDCYDNCIAHLDEQIGRLIDELGRRAVLEHTWVIITSDHGESFGETPGIFWHGTSVYETQLHVPLVIMPPAGGPSPQVVRETVSLRDLAATIAHVSGFAGVSPFPGTSLARYWNQAAPASGRAPEQALAELVPLPYSTRDPSVLSRKRRWPQAAVTEGDWTYIRKEGEGREELYREHEGSPERRNLADHPAARPRLEKMRRALGKLTAGPLTPERFNP